MQLTPFHAVQRFGFGRRGNDPLPDDPRHYLASQLDAPDPLLTGPGPSTQNGMRVYIDEDMANKIGGKPPVTIGDLFHREAAEAVAAAVATDLPFREHLVWFWSNHFTMSAKGGPAPLALAGAYVREAIRPHVTGRFADMLNAVMRHPAMLYYLNNDVSFGPHSPAGIRDHRGLNENLARECLELHTLGVNGGYTQTDVTTFAAILTGRTVTRDGPNPGFQFREDAHEPGPKHFLGRSFPEGFAGSEMALQFIADHPSTHRHVATQMVRHFVADGPPKPCVDRVATVLAGSGGDLKQAVLAIVDMPEAWEPLTKLRSPAEYVVAVARANGMPSQPPARLLGATHDLGQPEWFPLLPNGWPDTAEGWLSGESLLKRADWAMTQASLVGAPDATAIADTSLGELCSASTKSAIKACPNPTEALAMLFASPEFMRR